MVNWANEVQAIESDDEFNMFVEGEYEFPDRAEIVKNHFPKKEMVQWPLKTTRNIIKILGPLLLALSANPYLEQKRDLACMEYFCGVRAVAQGFQYMQLPAGGFDVRESLSRNMLGYEGSHMHAPNFSC